MESLVCSLLDFARRESVFCARAPNRNSPRDGDGAIKVDQCESDGFIKQVTKSSANNVYVYSPHSIMAKISTYVADRITLSPSQTFRGNREARIFTYAGLSRALLSYDVGRSYLEIGR